MVIQSSPRSCPVRSALYLLLLLCSVALGSPIATAEEQPVETSDAPDWVKTVERPSVDSLPIDQIQNGIHYLLLDTQIKVSDDSQPIFFARRAERIINNRGVEQASQVNISYDPSYQSLILHSLKLIRNGTLIDKIPSARMSHIQREAEMEDLIYSGMTTLNIILDDVRSGDILEYSYSVQGMNPVYQGLFAYDTSLSWSVPVSHVSERLLWNKARPLHHRITNSSANVVHKTTERGAEYLIQVNNTPPVKIEDDTPSWFNPWGHVVFSELDSWAEVANWGEQLYDDVYTYDAVLNQLVEKIRIENDTLDAQIAAALRFTQDEVRYLGIELGENSHRPTSATQTLSNRYGDCKDKSVLLIALLRGLGVEAHPVLVNTEQRIEEMLPNIQAFDHVITTLEHNGKRYWLDPTRSYQGGGIDQIHQPDYGHALILKPGTTSLTAMTPNQSEHGSTVHEYFVIPEHGPVQFSVHTVDRGWNAETQRYNLAADGRDQLQDDYLSFLQSYYPGARVEKPLEYSDDTLNNSFSTKEYYLIEDFWYDNVDEGKQEADFHANLVGSWIEIPDQLSRSQPLHLPHPSKISQTVAIDFPSDDWHFDEETFVENNDFFQFNYAASFDKTQRRLTLHFDYQSKAPHVEPERYTEYREALKRADEYTEYGIYYTEDNNSEAETSDFPGVATILLIYAGLYLLVFILWRLDRRRNPDTEESVFFPVTPLKMIVLWVFTFGFYGVYWFYRNFRYLKEQRSDASMPVARGIFYTFWYYPLWSALNSDSEQRYGSSHLPAKWLAVILALLFLVAGIATGADALVLPAMLICALLALPLANYIAFANTDNAAAMAKNSQWAPRHFLLILLSLPLCILTFGAEVGLMPNGAVIEGNRVLKHDIQFMQRKGIIKASDKIELFYSDALFLVRDDGNGFTQRHVFSYWKEDDSFHQETAEYDDIKDIDITQGESVFDNSTITITRQDNSEFVLFVSRLDGKDSDFVKKLKDNWHKKETDF